jgi:hypothetical protein
MFILLQKHSNTFQPLWLVIVPKKTKAVLKTKALLEMGIRGTAASIKTLKAYVCGVFR